jgi:hypothetical protein
MLSEERIKLMTRMACYEQGEGKKNAAIGSYFRGDYIGLQVIRSVINATIAFVILFAMYIFYDLEVIMEDIYKMDLLEFGKAVVIRYLIFTLVYSLISYGVFAFKYSKARMSLKTYYNNLKKLAYLYDRENKK